MKHKDSKHQDLLEESTERYATAVKGWQDIYTVAADDLKFVYDINGGQWDQKMRDKRVEARRPVLTLNKVLKFIRQLRGEQMQNRPRIKVIPVDNKGDVGMADLYDGLIRQIEYLSTAGIAYDTAYASAIACSIGFFRIVTEFTNDQNLEKMLDQNILIKRILNPFAVHFDPTAVDFMLSDARYCFIEESMEKKQFLRKYPGADTKGFSGDTTGVELENWFLDDKIKVAEYFYKEPTNRQIAQLNTGEIIELNNKITTEYLYSIGKLVVKERKVNSHKVMWVKRSGSEILEGPTAWAGKYIPIIPVFGDEVVVNGQKHYLSVIRGTKDPQRMYNYWASSATEHAMASPRPAYLVDHRQIDGFTAEWEDVDSNKPYKRYTAIEGVAKPEREEQIGIPTAIVNMMQLTALDIEDHLGRYEASKGEASNERSGKAIGLRIAQSDKGTFTYTENFLRSIIYGGKQLIDLIPKIYDTRRALRVRGETGDEKIVEVNIPVMDDKGNMGIGNDLSLGEFDIISTIGASFASKREEMNSFMLNSMQYAPRLAEIIAPLMFKYGDMPGAQEIYDELKKEVERLRQEQGIDANKTIPSKPASVDQIL